MINLTNPDDLLLLRRTELTKRNIIDSLPVEIVGNSSDEVGLAVSIEKILYRYLDSEVVKTDSRPTRMGVQTLTIPQIEMYHQFPVEDHLLITAYAAYNFDTILEPLFDDHSRLFDSITYQDRLELAIAGYLHDIEKLLSVTQRPFNPEAPHSWFASARTSSPTIAWQGVKQDAELTEQLKKVNGSKESREVIINHLLRTDINDSDVLAGILPRLFPNLNLESIKRMLTAYEVFDTVVINIWQSKYGSLIDRKPTTEIIREAVQELSDNFSGMSQRDVLKGILVALADNFAQGIPESMNDLFPIHQHTNLILAQQILNHFIINHAKTTPKI